MNNDDQNQSNELETNNLEKHRELLDKDWDELLKRNLSNTENLAKYVFSLSSAGLGISLVVVKDMELLSIGDHKWVLIVSWAAFLFTILFALISYLTSLHGIDKEFDRIEEEYEREYEEETEVVSDNKMKKPGKATIFLRYVYVTFCIIGIFCTPLFIWLNFKHL